MNSSVFDKDTLLDLTVNIVPLFILAFFIVGYLVVNPWGFDNPLLVVVSHGLMLFTFLALAVLTYVAAVKIEGGE
ncbi:DUF6684 family protein [Halobacterium wangiae]|uniref:DUF6684 family protein n=1 Tax=Halobacterium wangiae TaxID=2902623 RepID=UPI001E64A915|nr:DUF6684 family protein [Halobacterium wangiae]